VIAALDIAARRVLVVLDRGDELAVKSFRNLPDVHVLTVDQLNTYDVVVSDVVVITKAALPLIGTGQRSDTPAKEADVAVVEVPDEVVALVNDEANEANEEDDDA
jgi:large subunit ribosomal protein L4